MAATIIVRARHNLFNTCSDTDVCYMSTWFMETENRFLQEMNGKGQERMWVSTTC